MKKKILSAILATCLAIPVFTPISYALEILHETEENITNKEITELELNNDKDGELLEETREEENNENNSEDEIIAEEEQNPIDASDNHIIKFKNDKSKEFIVKALTNSFDTTFKKGIEEDITVGDIKSLRTFAGNFDGFNQEDISLEGIQYAQNLIEVRFFNGIYNEEQMERLLEPIDVSSVYSFGLIGYNLKEIPSVNKFKDVTCLEFVENKLEDLRNLEYYENLKVLMASRNNIKDISNIKIFNNQLSHINLSYNKINSEAFNEAFNVEYPELSKDPHRVFSFSYNQITDTRKVWNALPGAKNTLAGHFGKQEIIKIIEEEEFEFPMKAHMYAGTKGWDRSGDVDVNLDSHSSIHLISNGKYKLENPEDDSLLNLYWNTKLYNNNIDGGMKDYIANPGNSLISNIGREGPSQAFSGLIKLVNLIPINKAIEKAITDPNEENLNEAKIKLNNIEELSRSLNSEELNEKIIDFKKQIIKIENLENEYTSEANPIPPSFAKDTDVVNFTNDAFRITITENIGKQDGEEITVGDMRRLERIQHVSYRPEPDRLTGRSVGNFEGIQYAQNANYIELISYRGIGYWLSHDRYIMNPELLDSEFKYTGLLKPFKNLTNLKKLYIDDSKITSKDLEDLKNLDLSGLQVSDSFLNDLTPIVRFENLEFLNLSGNFITDGSPIKSLKKLEELYMAVNGIDNIEFLSELTELKTIRMNRNIPWLWSFDKSMDLSPLASLKKLEHLMATANGIIDISPLSELTSLKQVTIDANRVTDLSSLDGLENLLSANNGVTIGLRADMQKPYIVLEDGNYKFDLPIKHIDCKELFIDRDKDSELKHLGDFKYELIDKNAVHLTRDYNKNWEHGEPRTQFEGTVSIFNKNKVVALVNKAKSDPTERNINFANDALDMLFYLPTQRDYVETVRAELEELSNKTEEPTVPTPPTKPTPPVTNVKLPPGVSDEGSAGSGEGSSQQFDFVPSESTIRNGDKNVSLDSLVMFKFNKAVSHPDTLTLNSDKIMVYDESGNKVNVEITATPRNVAKPSKYKDQDEFELDYRKYLTINFLDGLKANKTYKITLRSSIQAKNGSTTAQAYDINFSTIGTSRPPVIPPYTPPFTPIITVTDVELNKSETIIKDSSLQLQATVNPSNAANKNIRWTSSDESIATVDANGKVTGISEGAATITVTTVDGNKTASSKVTVIEDILLDLDLEEENSEKIVKIEPKYNQPKDKEWTVKFNQKLKNVENLNSSVFVLDKDNIIQNVEVIIGDDLKSIKIIPSREQYKSGEKYRIIIKDVKNENNQTLKKPTLMDFTVK